MKKILGNLYIVATPIGNLGDISYRAVKILGEVDLVAAEDTRHSKILLQHYGIKTPLISLHNYNETGRSGLLIDKLLQGQSIALISDAGTPLISDPGAILVSEVRAANINVIPIPGACAAIAALSASGLSTTGFAFEGFLPTKVGPRRKRLAALVNEPRTLIIYEAPHRLLKLLDEMLAVFGAARYVVIARELTKTFETIYGANLADLRAWVVADKNQQKGEFVILVAGLLEQAPVSVADVEVKKLLEVLRKELPSSQAVKVVAKITGVERDKVYKIMCGGCCNPN